MDYTFFYPYAIIILQFLLPIVWVGLIIEFIISKSIPIYFLSFTKIKRIILFYQIIVILFLLQSTKRMYVTGSSFTLETLKGVNTIEYIISFCLFLFIITYIFFLAKKTKEKVDMNYPLVFLINYYLKISLRLKAEEILTRIFLDLERKRWCLFLMIMYSLVFSLRVMFCFVFYKFLFFQGTLYPLTLLMPFSIILRVLRPCFLFLLLSVNVDVTYYLFLNEKEKLAFAYHLRLFLLDYVQIKKFWENITKYSFFVVFPFIFGYNISSFI